MINFEKLQDDNFKLKIIEDRWKIDETNQLNLNLMDILEQNYGIEFIQYENDIFVPMNLTYIGGDGFSSVYKINGNDNIVIKVTNESSEIRFTEELIKHQTEKRNIYYNNYFVKCQMLIPSNILTENNTEDFHKKENIYIILENLENLSDIDKKLLDQFDDYYIEITGDSIFSDIKDIDLQRFYEILNDFVESTFEQNDYENRDLFYNFSELIENTIDLIIENNWYDFNPKNIMKTKNGKLKIIDLQSGR